MISRLAMISRIDAQVEPCSLLGQLYARTAAFTTFSAIVVPVFLVALVGLGVGERDIELDIAC